MDRIVCCYRTVVKKNISRSRRNTCYTIILHGHEPAGAVRPQMPPLDPPTTRTPTYTYARGANTASTCARAYEYKYARAVAAGDTTHGSSVYVVSSRRRASVYMCVRSVAAGRRVPPPPPPQVTFSSRSGGAGTCVRVHTAIYF